MRVFLSRLIGVFRRRDVELDEEIQTHLELLAQENVARGMDGAAARRAARRAFGGLDQVKERYRDQRGLPALESWWSDIRYACRTLRKSPGFTTVAVAMIALGVGVNAAVFTVTHAVLFRGFPNADPENRVLYMSTNHAASQGQTSYPDFEDWRAQAKSFDDVALVNSGGVRTRVGVDGRPPETYGATRLSANAFRVLGRPPILGRDFESADEQPGATAVVIVSYGLWERRYGKDPSIIGRSVRLNSTPATWGATDLTDSTRTTIIGVMPPEFDFPHHRVDLWLPLVATAGLPLPDIHDRQRRNFWFAFGRLAQGVTLEAARAELETIGRRLERAYPVSNRGVLPELRTFDQFWLGPNARLLYGSMWGAIAFVLLIACANLASLLLARTVGRSRELSVRMALGAGRWRVIRQILVESLMLAAAGGVVGWWIAAWSLRSYNLLATPPNAYNRWEYTMDHRVLAYLVAISIGTGLLFGIAPVRRLLAFEINGTVNDGSRGATRGRRKHLSDFLVTAEVALAIVLLAGAGVLIRNVVGIATTNIGVDTTNVLVAPIGLPKATYSDAQLKIVAVERLVQRLASIPSVESVATGPALPTGFPMLFGARPYEVAGVSFDDGQRRPTVVSLNVSPAYFHTLGVRLIAGRPFADTDDDAGAPAAIVNERFANAYWPGENPLGRRLRFFQGTTPEAWLSVVGVVSNVVQRDRTGQRFDPLVYRPFRQQPDASTFVFARTAVPPGHLAGVFQREIQALDPDLLLGPGGPSPLDERLRSNYWSEGVNGTLFLVFAALALALASIGLYAVVAHNVSRRTQEMGIRSAMGATARDIRALVLREGMRPVGIGVAVGLAGAVALTPVLKSQLVTVSPVDPVSLVVACAALMSTATLGCLVPAHRAARVDPMTALRSE